jgi:capsular exopolysaccharide synthesis family protein
MELREVLKALRFGWWLLVLGLVVGGAAGYGATLLQTPVYTSHTQLFVSTNGSGSTFSAFEGSLFSQQRAESYARLLSGEELASLVAQELGLGDSPGGISGAITAEVVADTVLIDVAVTDPSPERAARIAEAVGQTFPSLVNELETPEGERTSPIKVTVTDPPEIPATASAPSTSRNVTLGALVGLMIGTFTALLRNHLDRSVNNPEQAAATAGAPVIGLVLRDPAIEKNHVLQRSSSSRAAEDYRQLRTNLQFLNVDEPPKVIMITSALPGEGKTTVAVNLAVTLADAGRSVTIVEADLRRPKVTRYLGLVGGAGVTNILAGTADLAEVVQAYGDGGISVVGAGPTPPNPGEILASSHMAELLAKLRGHSDYVLVDAPPLLPVADSSGLAVMMDGVLLSVRHGSTTTDQLRQAVIALERVGAKTLGVILNIVPPKADFAAAYGYGYGYSDEPKPKHGRS